MERPKRFWATRGNVSQSPYVVAACDPAGEASDKSGSWGPSIELKGEAFLELDEAKLFRKWLDQAIEWLEAEEMM